MLVLTIALISFGLQSYITQTHIHFATSQVFGLNAPETLSNQAEVAFGKSTPQKKAPANDDPANCPICQAVAHAGQFVTPSAIVFSLPSEAVAIVPLCLAIAIAQTRASHNWQSRAPPHH